MTSWRISPQLQTSRRTENNILRVVARRDSDHAHMTSTVRACACMETVTGSSHVVANRLSPQPGRIENDTA